MWKVRVRPFEFRKPSRLKRFLSAFLVFGALLSSRSAAAQSGLQVTYGANGLQTLTYNHVLLENVAALPGDAFHIWHMKATDLNGNLLTGSQYTWGEVNDGRSWDSSANTWTYNFVWGTIRLQYVQSGNTLNLITTTTNNAGSGIIFDGASLYPLALNFPTLPATFPASGSPTFADNVSAPSISTADFGTGEVVAVAPNASLPLYSGFQTTGTGYGYTALISSTSPDSLASFLPHNDRPVQPGQTDTFTISLRFAPTGTSASTLATDVYSSWVQTYPPVLNWNDRRAIGTAYLASSPSGSNINQSGGYPTNPRRYFNDSTVNITTPAGLASFQARILAQAQSNVTNSKLLNAQGAITWDIEGEQYPQDTSYVCSPDQIATVAPEMESIVNVPGSAYNGMKLDDAYFKTMTAAGLRIGICIRPQQFAINADGTAQQTTLPDSQVAAELVGKVQYAHNRWGVTLFYIDSTVNALGGTLPASIFQQVAAAFPDSLLIPEESTPLHYAYVAPFQSFIFNAALGTPSSVYNYYPNAFSATLVNDVAASTLSAAQAQLTQQVKQGDILMAHVDYWQANNPTIVQIYQNAGTWTNPAAPTTVATALGVTASAVSVTFDSAVNLTATLAPARATGTVTFFDGSTALGSSTLSSGVAILSSSALAVGTHTITAAYSGTTGYAPSTSAATNVVVNDMPTSTSLSASAPSLLLGLPETLNVTVTAGTTAAQPTGTVKFTDGGVQIGTALLSNGNASFTTALAAGSHSLQAVYSGNGSLASSVSALVAVGVATPSATTTAISTSASSILVGATLTLNSTVSPAATGSVTFYDGSTALGVATLTSGSAVLTSSTLAVGTHTLTAAYSGSTINLASSSSAQTVVVNAAPVTAAPVSYTTNLLGDPGFELQTSSQVSAPWTTIGNTAMGIDRNLGNAHSGLNNGYVWNNSNTWNAIAQTVAVQPNTEYVYSGWVRSSLVGQIGYFSVDGQTSILNEVSFGELSQYTYLVVRFNSGSNTSVRVRVGFWGQNTVQWIQIDDLALRVNLVADPSFELQTSSTLASPWLTIGTSPQGVDRAIGNAHWGANEAYIWDDSTSWNAIAQMVSVQANTNYALSAWIRNSLVANVGYLSVDGGSSILSEVNFGSLPGYTRITVPFNSGNNTTVRVRAGFWGQGTVQWLQLDDVTVQQMQ